MGQEPKVPCCIFINHDSDVTEELRHQYARKLTKSDSFEFEGPQEGERRIVYKKSSDVDIISPMRASEYTSGKFVCPTKTPEDINHNSSYSEANSK